MNTTRIAKGLVTAALLGALMPASNAVIALGRAWTGAAMNAGWAAVFVACALVMVKDGADGLASARLIAYAAHAVWTLAFMAHVLARRAPQHAGDDR